MKGVLFIIGIVITVVMLAEPIPIKKDVKENKSIFNLRSGKKLMIIRTYEPFYVQGWLKETNNRSLIPVVKRKFSKEVDLASKKFGIADNIIYAIIIIESSGDPNKIGDDGQSRGLMGVKTLHAKKKNIPVKKLFDPETNILLGAEYLKELHNRYKNLDKAIVAYNCKLKSLNNITNFKRAEYYQKVMALAS